MDDVADGFNLQDLACKGKLAATAAGRSEAAVAHRVEEAFKVEVDYVHAAIIDYALRSPLCVMTATPRTEAAAAVRKQLLIDEGQYLIDGLLHQSVCHGGDSQKSHLAVVRRNRQTQWRECTDANPKTCC